MVSLLDELRAAPTDRQALRALFQQHAEPSDSWPDHHAVRAHAEGLRQEGDAYRAAWILIACLEDLRRFFEQPDDDSDAGWHRQQAKQWESWATARALRRTLLVLGEAPHGEAIRLACRELLSATLEDWGEPCLSAALQDEPAPTPEQVVADHASQATQIDLDVTEGWLDEAFGVALGDGPLMDRVAMLREAVEELRARGEHEAAAHLSLMGLAVACRLEDGDEVAFSDERDAVLGEQLRVFDDALRVGVGRVGLALRVSLRKAAGRASSQLLQRLRAVLGTDDSEAVADIARLQQRRATATSDDERFDIDMQLVGELGSYLDDDTYLAVCQERGWIGPAIERLLARQRVADAVAMAESATSREGDREVVPFALLGIVEQLLGCGEPGHAERLLAPWADHDALHAEAFVRCLAGQNKGSIRDACVNWFKRRPTAATYRAIAQRLSPQHFAPVRTLLIEHATSRRLLTTVFDIAIGEGDVAAIEELVPQLDAAEIEHARQRGSTVIEQLSPEAAARLAPPSSDAPASSGRDPASPSPPAIEELSPEAGDRVTHKKFGDGTVVRVHGDGGQAKLVIDFASHGEKTLLSQFVRPIPDP